MSTEHNDPKSKKTSEEMNGASHEANQCVYPGMPPLKQQPHRGRPARVRQEVCPHLSSASTQADANFSGTSLKGQIFSAAACAFLGFNSKPT